MKNSTNKPGKLIIYIGLPGSGKSTLAARELEKDPSIVEINRDDERTRLYGESYHNGPPVGKQEAAVTMILRNRMLKVLRAGGTVINSDTNTNLRFLNDLVRRATEVGAEIETVSVDVSIEEAKRRNRLRGEAGGRFVPEDVIDSMAKRVYSEDGHIKDAVIGGGKVFFVDKETPGMREIAEFNSRAEKKYPILGQDILVLDIDGTLAFNHEAIDQHIGSGKKDWDAFYAASSKSPVNQSVLSLVNEARNAGLTIFAMTGRVDKNATDTIKFIENSGAPVSRLYMGRNGDWRGDYHVKKSNLLKLQTEGFRAVHSVDDRPSSIKLWEDFNIAVSRVPSHDAGEVREASFYKEPQVDSTLSYTLELLEKEKEQ